MSTSAPTRRQLLELDELLQSSDARKIWQGAEELGEHAKAHPHEIWELLVKHWETKNPELQYALATCVLEHILEYHFDEFFPRVEGAISEGNLQVKELLRRCWKFGASEIPANSQRWDAVLRNRH